MTECSYAPRSQVLAWLRKGWRLCDDHDYDESDWAIVMELPEQPDALSDAEMDAIARRFKREFTPIMLRSTKGQGSSSGSEKRNTTRWQNRVYDKVLRRLVPA